MTGTIEPANFAKRAESNVLVDRVRMVCEGSRGCEESPKIPEKGKETQEGDTECYTQGCVMESQKQDGVVYTGATHVRQRVIYLVKRLARACGSAEEGSNRAPVGRFMTRSKCGLRDGFESNTAGQSEMK